MNTFYIEVNKKDIAYVNRKLADAPGKAARVLRNAINQTATVANRKIKNGRSAGYTIKAGAFNSEIQIQRANLGHLDATIKSQGRPRTIQQFKISRPKSGVKADITKSGLKNLVNAAGAAAFVAPGGRASGLIVQRETKARYPLKVLHSNSVPMMVSKIYEGERGGQGELQPFIEKTLHDKIREQVKKIL